MEENDELNQEPNENQFADDAVSQTEMLNSFEESGEFTGKVNVNINEVCQKAGCWINFKKKWFY